jgi:hypothetical protein
MNRPKSGRFSKRAVPAVTGQLRRAILLARKCDHYVIEDSLDH